MQFTAASNCGKARVACEPFKNAKVAESSVRVHNAQSSDQAMAAKWSDQAMAARWSTADSIPRALGTGMSVSKFTAVSSISSGRHLAKEILWNPSRARKMASWPKTNCADILLDQGRTCHSKKKNGSKFKPFTPWWCSYSFIEPSLASPGTSTLVQLAAQPFCESKPFSFSPLFLESQRMHSMVENAKASKEVLNLIWEGVQLTYPSQEICP